MKPIVAVLMGALFLALPSPASAVIQTWVASDGSNSNPCSRAAPCAEWQTAINAVESGGEVTAVDSDYYGFAVIDKSITLDGGPELAGMQYSTDAVSIDAPGQTVTLRRLRITGLRDVSPNLPKDNFGISIVRARHVRVENVLVTDFGRAGIRFTASSPSSRLTVTDSLIAHNAGYGLAAAAPTSGATGSVNRVNLRNVALIDNGAGGVTAEATGATGVIVNVSNSLVADNAADGVRSNGARAKLRISNNDINGNAQGLRALNGGAILSFGNNRVVDNGIDGAPTVIANPK